MKVCSKCKEQKDVGFFYLRKGKPDSWCKMCYKDANTKYVKTDEWKIKKKGNANKPENKIKKALADKLYRENNMSAIKESKKQYYINNKDTISKKVSARYQVNKEHVKTNVLLWKTKNKDKVNAYVMHRLTTKKQACPKWLTEDDKWMIEEAYSLAKLREQIVGGVWHVDHIIPLQNNIVCGMHVPWNLQVIPESVNCSKRNTFVQQ